MKIAIVTDNGTHIAQHFGRARYYQVFSVGDKPDAVSDLPEPEMRDRAGTLHHGTHHNHGEHSGHAHHHEGHHTHGGTDSGSPRPSGAHSDSARPSGADRPSSAAPHGTGPHAADRHRGMMEQLKDVDVLIAGGMGYGARRALADAGIKVLATNERDTRAAVQRFLSGALDHQDGLVH